MSFCFSQVRAYYKLLLHFTKTPLVSGMNVVSPTYGVCVPFCITKHEVDECNQLQTTREADPCETKTN